MLEVTASQWIPQEGTKELDRNLKVTIVDFQEVTNSKLNFLYLFYNRAIARIEKVSYFCILILIIS